jgi:hypothetical protein
VGLRPEDPTVAELLKPVGLEMGILTPNAGFGNVVWHAASGLR